MPHPQQQDPERLMRDAPQVETDTENDEVESEEILTIEAVEMLHDNMMECDFLAFAGCASSIQRSYSALLAQLATARREGYEQGREEAAKIAERLQTQYERDDEDDAKSPYPTAMYLSGYWHGTNAAKEIGNGIRSLQYTERTPLQEGAGKK